MKLILKRFLICLGKGFLWGQMYSKKGLGIFWGNILKKKENNVSQGISWTVYIGYSPNNPLSTMVLVIVT